MSIFSRKPKREDAKAVARAAPKGRTLRGVVASDKMKDTVVVVVTRTLRHPKYGKLLSRRKRYKAHDAGNTKKIGEKVTIAECRPMSRDKRFTVIA
ncbi:MAG TPA: 30S ribosomal protein S17 [Candidatus Paceibacterota bacterium]